MKRTPEQIAADTALTEAIERAIAAYWTEGGAWVLTEYVVCVSQARWDDHGDQLTAVGVIYRDGDVPHHRALGLVEYVAARIRKQITDDDPSEEDR